MLDEPWKIELLGGLRLHQGGRSISRFRTYKTGVLLAYLVYYPHRSHPREELTELLWPDCDPDAGRNSLSTSLSSLRHQLEPPGVTPGSVIVADRANVRLNPDSFTSDVALFESAIAAAKRTGNESKRASLLMEAVDLYHGALLPGYYEDWNLAERDRLAGSYIGALGELVVHFEEAAEHRQALEFARRAVTADPLHEESHRSLIRLYAARSELTAALRQYAILERALKSELGAEPEPATRALIASIRTRGPVAESAGLPKTSLPTRVPSKLPSGTVTLLVADTAETPQHAVEIQRMFARAAQTFEGVPQDWRDGLFAAVFGRASDALAFAIAGQRALAGNESAEGRERAQSVGGREHSFTRTGLAGPSPAVSMALHTGEITAERKRAPNSARSADAVRAMAARLLSAAHGGQILCSEGTAALLSRDLEPGLRLTGLGLFRVGGIETPERLFEADYPDRPVRQFPPPRAAPGHSGGLPMEFTRFFGREIAIEQLRSLVSPGARLVTLTGPGGMGKTRLALEIARQELERYCGAVWFVPLASVTDPALLPQSVCSALRLPNSAQTEPLDQIVEALSQQPSLLILDNFEQLMSDHLPDSPPASASSNTTSGPLFVRSLLTRIPQLTCLVTSRRRLNLAGEHEFPVSPLPVPDSPDTPVHLNLHAGVQLYVDRSQAVSPDFQLTAGNAAAVAALCERLEGIPLALELAAARSAVMTPAQMLKHLNRRLDDRILASRRPDWDSRHHTMRAAVDWSYQLLSPDIQHFLAQLSVFEAGWTAEAAEVVCEQPLALDYLAQLRDWSFVAAGECPEDIDGAIRFRMLETLREYADEKLSSEQRERRKRDHAVYFLAFAEEAGKHLTGPDQAAWLAQLEADHDNLRAALRWAIDGAAVEMSLRLASVLGRFWLVRGHWTEGRAWLARALEMEGVESQKLRVPSSEVRDPAPGTRNSHLSTLNSQLDTQHSILNTLTCLRADALDAAGHLAYYQGDYTNARKLHEESLALRKDHPDRRAIASALHNLGNVTYGQGDYRAAHSLFEESLAIWRETGDKIGTASALHNLGGVTFGQGDYPAARSLYEESLALRREAGERRGVAAALFNLSLVLWYQKDATTVRSMLEESLAIRRDLKDMSGIASSLSRLGHILMHEGDLTAARAALEQSLAIRRELGDRPGVAALLHTLGNVALGAGACDRACELFEESTAICRETGDREKLSDCLEGFAGLAVQKDMPERAAQLFGAEEALRESIGAALNLFGRPYYERNVAAVRSRLGEDAFISAWTVGRAMTPDQALLL